MHKNTQNKKTKKQAPKDDGPEVPRDGEFEIDRRFKEFARAILNESRWCAEPLAESETSFDN